MSSRSSFFSAADCLLCSQAAAFAYGRMTPGTEAAQAAWWEAPEWIADVVTDTEAFIAANDETLLIAFRGTEPDALRDWITDADFHLGSTGTQRLHHGFYRALNSVRDPLLHRVRQWQRPGRRVLLAGHSLGGALAMLAALLLRDNGLPVDAVYTFGQPRVGDAAFAARYDAQLKDRTFRLVNSLDLVPRLPGVLLHYRHAGREVLLEPLGPALFDLPLLPKLLLDSLAAWQAFRQGRIALLQDHFLAAYRNRVENAFAVSEVCARAQHPVAS